MKASMRTLISCTFAAIAIAVPQASAQPDKCIAPPRIAPRGLRLPGPEFAADCAFDFIDWNGDGKLDLYLPSNSMNTAYAYVNEGTKTQPKFGHGLWYPINLTETEPYGMYFVQTQQICDLDHDGLWDLLVYDGQFRWVHNKGTKLGPVHWYLAQPKRDPDPKAAPKDPKQKTPVVRDPNPYFSASPSFHKENARKTNVPESMYWNRGIFPRQVLTFTVADWDGDGLEDLIICRFKDETPDPIKNPKIDKAPERGLYFYKNMGTKEKPYFDVGVEITTPDGKSIAAPNPIVTDIDGDGVLDIVACETTYTCNSYRVDWPTHKSLVFFRRPNKADVSKLEPAKDVTDSTGKPVPSGTQVRVADFRGVGVNDLFVMDPNAGLRWYQNVAKSAKERPSFSPPTRLSGTDFSRFLFMYQPMVVDWFGPNSRDLVIHGGIDAHCQWALRRTALYKNVSKQPGDMQYEFVGYFNFNGALAMVPQHRPFEERPGDTYGSFVAFPPAEKGSVPRRMIQSVNGQLYQFDKLAADGLTFERRTPIEIPQTERKFYRSCPVLVDWNRDGKVDLVLGITFSSGDNGNVGKPHEKEYRVYLNKGTNEEPKFDDYVPFRDEKGDRIKLAASPTRLATAPQCGIAVYDRDGKHFDLVTEDEKDATGLRYYQNVSVDPKEPRFRFVKTLGDPLPVEVKSSHPYRYFYFGDADRDGVPDLLLFTGAFMIFKGIADDAPAEAANLAVSGSGKDGVEVSWKRPAGAAKFDLRLSDKPLAVGLDWNRLPNVAGDYTAAEGDVQKVKIPSPTGPLAEHPTFWFAVKSFGAKGQASAISNSVEAAAPPLKRIVLRNGPAASAETPNYAGAEACWINANEPRTITPRKSASLTLLANYKQRMILIRFNDLPKLGAVEQATLELTSDSMSFEKSPLQCQSQADLTCNLFRDDWDVHRATFSQAADGKPWKAADLVTGGTMQSMVTRPQDLTPNLSLRFDVTSAVREAIKAGKSSISLLIRAEHNGPYSQNQGYTFCGPDWERIEHRPKLAIVTRE